MSAVAVCPPWGPPVATKPVEDKPDLPTETVRLKKDLVQMLRVICTHTLQDGKRIKLGDYLDEMIREKVIKAHDKVLQEIADRQTGKKKPKDA